MSEPKRDRELTETEKQILLADLTSLYMAQPTSWNQALSLVQSTTAVTLSTIISIVVTKALVPADLRWAILALYVTATSVYLFLAIRVGLIVWNDGWREELAARLGAWKEPGLSWRNVRKSPSRFLRSMGRFYAWPYSQDWTMHVDQYHQFLSIGLVFFGALAGFLSAVYCFIDGIPEVLSALLGIVGAVAWILIMRTVTSFQIHTFDSNVKRRVKAAVSLPQELVQTERPNLNVLEPKRR